LRATPDHEYAVHGGFNRSRIGQVLAVIAAAISAMLIGAALASIQWLESIGWKSGDSQILIWPIGVTLIYLILYWLFSQYMWRWSPLATFLKVSNLAGTWRCNGQTINADKSLGYQWTAEVTIIQNWDRIRVRLKTPQSGSTSQTASIIADPEGGCTLIYNYKNDPNLAEPELQPHQGFACLRFAPGLKSAEGEYFNGQGRFTFGTMTLDRT